MSRPKTFHVFQGSDIEFSTATGTPVPALCGRWQPANLRWGEPHAGRSERRVCGSCMRVMRSRGLTLRNQQPIPQEAR